MQLAFAAQVPQLQLARLAYARQLAHIVRVTCPGDLAHPTHLTQLSRPIAYGASNACAALNTASTTHIFSFVVAFACANCAQCASELAVFTSFCFYPTLVAKNPQTPLLYIMYSKPSSALQSSDPPTPAVHGWTCRGWTCAQPGSLGVSFFYFPVVYSCIIPTLTLARNRGSFRLYDFDPCCLCYY